VEPPTILDVHHFASSTSATMLAFAWVSPRVAPAARPRSTVRKTVRPPSAPSRRGVSVIRSAMVPDEPKDEDFILFNSVLSSGDIQGAIREAAVEGTLTPATLGAAYVVFDKCKALQEDAPVLKTLESVILLITQTLQQLNATPAVRLIDELMTFDPLVEAPLVRLRMQEAYDSKKLTKEELSNSLQMMIDGMSEQDEAWERHVAAQVTETTDKEKFEQLIAHANGRMEAKRRLTQIQTMCAVQE
jgi:hypothetical protein